MKKVILMTLLAMSFVLPLTSFAKEASFNSDATMSPAGAGDNDSNALFSQDGDSITLADASDSMSPMGDMDSDASQRSDD